jgi:hypothetical protein
MFAAILAFAGSQPFNDWFAPDTTQRHPLGLRIVAVDPFWGLGTFMYVKSTDAILKGSLCAWNELGEAGLLPSAVTQGFPWGVAMAPMASGTFGWVQVEGRAVYKTNATVAADGVVAIAAAGILGATATGKQLLGVRNRKSATATESILLVNTVTGSGVLYCVNGYDGLFLGAALSGTGIPASTIVVKLGADGKTAYAGTTIGGAADKLATATGTITLTATYTGYGSGVINNPSTIVTVA